MSQHVGHDPRTASSESSIWRDLPEDIFRRHLVELEERTNAVPIKPQVFDLEHDQQCDNADAYLLPLDVEQQIADDFSYIAAVGEGAQSVSAVCVEVHRCPPRLYLCFAAIDTINEQLQQSLREVGNLIALTLKNKRQQEKLASDLCKLIVELHFQKLLGRLRSAKWHKPRYLSRTHKKSLWQDFDNLIHRVQHVYPKKNNPIRAQTETQVCGLRGILHAFEDVESGSRAEMTKMADVVKACYSFCLSTTMSDFTRQLDAVPNATPQIAAAIKTLRQVEKIGAYQRIVFDMIKMADQYPELFSNIEFKYLKPFSNVRTNIGYEDWAKTMHVHAEVQLVTYYDLARSRNKTQPEINLSQVCIPRVIGTSKHLCYLCFLFLKHHCRFVPANTHGRLYDQWTVPDLAEYDDNTRHKYRSVIQEIDFEVLELSEKVGARNGKRDAWRVEPMTSRQNLLLK